RSSRRRSRRAPRRSCSPASSPPTSSTRGPEMRTAILLCFATTAATATAYADNNELTIGGTARALRTTSANALTDDSLGGGTFAYARRLDLELLPGLELWPEATFAWGAA